MNTSPGYSPPNPDVDAVVEVPAAGTYVVEDGDVYSVDQIRTEPVPEPMSLDEITGANIRAARKAAGMTQEQLADCLTDRGWKTHPTALTRIESGTRSVRVNQLDLIAAALDTTPPNLMRAPGARERHIYIVLGEVA